MTYDLVHASNSKIQKVLKDGRFGSFLFFDSNLGDMSVGHVYYHCLSISKDKILEQNHIFYDEALDNEDILSEVDSIIAELAKQLEIEIEEAEELVSGKMTACDLDNIDPCDAGEIDWDIQLYVGRIAVAMGYRGYCFEDDANGTSYMIDMFNHENEFSLITDSEEKVTEWKRGDI